MPIYAYQCTACGHELEALQKISDAPLTDCPACDEASLTKKVTAAAFRLSGGGWYETDFKSGSKKNVATNEAPPSPACGTGACPACQ
ncbi:MAG TPA: zinc ribbon domain-containing protein [Candidatus Thiothrix moscowensis]|uniref:FmdB family zinc ribbon protein n=1 Tax=unclassified Thiothrix TaxID=2636184 RepID=UPI001A2B3006|nr:MULTISPECIES: FmdB family zinc ribbon protein [unclassified Thiothrix]MBJ6609919.1 zinc ribbon domain-containing protein [Candidatus Thiothrix moscowensis]HRJ52589.1 zinc ribbon domain-containing protein [Candidatus Thiothrix moscowensis]HRJ94267.1 zinc ribbon domain-containing protein [Candidatus Thiothrix moscowensis]